MRRMSQVRVALSVALAAVAMGCGPSGDDYVPPEAPASSSAARRPSQEEAEDSVESRVAAMMETNERAIPNADMRDPFMQPRPQRGPAGMRGPRDVQGPDCNIEAEPLGKTELEDLTVIGLVTGTALPRAMFRMPGTAQAVIVTEGALAGPDCSNRLIDIRDNEVVFEQVTMSEQDRSITTLQLNESRVASRFIQIVTE